MIKTYSGVILAGALALGSFQVKSQELLTGNTRLACEAILCLSSSIQPTECSPSLSKYFSILIKKRGVIRWSETINARKAFLNMCPAVSAPNTSSEYKTTNMPALINDIANGAGRCDKDFLNRTLLEVRTRLECPRGMFGQPNEDNCETITYTIIKDTKPNYCRAYEENEVTILDSAKYVGTPESDGKWVASSEFDKAQRDWQNMQSRLNMNKKSRGIFN